jgi:hypothetical protein
LTIFIVLVSNANNVHKKKKQTNKQTNKKEKRKTYIFDIFTTFYLLLFRFRNGNNPHVSNTLLHED